MQAVAMRRARFDGYRQKVFGRPGSVRYVYVRTTYRGYQETTGLEVRPLPGALSMRHLPALPPYPPPKGGTTEASAR